MKPIVKIFLISGLMISVAAIFTCTACQKRMEANRESVHKDKLESVPPGEILCAKRIQQNPACSSEHLGDKLVITEVPLSEIKGDVQWVSEDPAGREEARSTKESASTGVGCFGARSSRPTPKELSPMDAEPALRLRQALGKTTTGKPPQGNNDKFESGGLAANTGPTKTRDLGKGSEKEPLGHFRRDTPPPVANHAGEGYPEFADHSFIRASDAGGDASTFGLDVDTASYSNVRRFLQAGQRPPRDAVRIEELINSMEYSYAAPSANSEHPFNVTTSLVRCPWNASRQLLRVAVKGKNVEVAERQPMNLVFLVDVSGSMSDANKLPLVVQCLRQLVKSLRPDDTVGIVTYASDERVVLPSTSCRNKNEILSALGTLSAGGSTNGAGGIRQAYTTAAQNRREGTISRVILCTDGDFNVGISRPDELKEFIAKEAKSGVFLNVYGFGIGNLQDQTAKVLAANGNGVYSYIDSFAEGQKTMVEGQTSQLVTIAKDAKCQIFFNPRAVIGWRQIGYEYRALQRQDFNNDAKDAGDIGAGHAVTILYEIIPAGRSASDPNPFIAQQQQVVERVNTEETLLRVRLRYKPPTSNTSVLMEQDVATSLTEMDRDFHVAAALAGYGMLLRGTTQHCHISWPLVQELALAGRGQDPSGQRAEFLKLVTLAKGLSEAR
jgi:secreted protein with Ig-like and vWFA domain